jgi:hypothetical protein
VKPDNPSDSFGWLEVHCRHHGVKVHLPKNEIHSNGRKDNGEGSHPLAQGSQLLSSAEDAQRYKFPNSIRGSWDADGGVLLDLGRGQLIRVNPIAALILKGIDEGESEYQIAQGIAALCEADLDTVRSDVCRFCELLEQQGLIARETTPVS